jgi:hypothetical protein
MKVALTRQERGCRLACMRADGTRTSADLGPRLPHHDLAHFVAERALGLRHGFYGNVARGYSLQELAQKSVIQQLCDVAWQAEIAARALGSLCAGACRLDQIEELVRAERAHSALGALERLTPELAARMQVELEELMARFARLADGETLELWFDVADDGVAARA